MKRLLIFFCALAVLVASEYYLLNELFAQRRWPVVAACAGALSLCVFVFLRFFKKSVVSH